MVSVLPYCLTAGNDLRTFNFNRVRGPKAVDGYIAALDLAVDVDGGVPVGDYAVPSSLDSRIRGYGDSAAMIKG